MSNFMDCLTENSYTDDGILISGHLYVATLAIIDRDTDRTYFVDICDRCGRYLAGYAEGETDEIEHYASVRKVGGGHDSI